MYRIFTDTSANLTAEMILKYDLTVVPLHYTVDGAEYPAPDGTMFEGKPFYDALRKGASVKTSMINTAAFIEAFEKSLAAGEDVIYIGMSGAISGSFQASAAAAGELRARFPERRIAVIDTRAASLGEGLVVLHAARMKREGADFNDLVAQIEKNSASVCQYFTVEDLIYLKKGGRISGAAALVGNILQIKPILTGDTEGRIVLFHKERGRNKALQVLADKFKELVSDLSLPAAIAHADCREEADRLARKIAEIGHRGSMLINCYEPVTGSHVGSGALALFFYGVRR